jgi:DNA-binding protein HU-beta
MFSNPRDSMKKGELIEAMATASGESQAATRRVLDSFFEVVTNQLKKGEDVTFTGFGSFKVAKRAARVGRNPATGAELKISASKGVRFSAGAPLKAALNPAKKKK